MFHQSTPTTAAQWTIHFHEALRAEGYQSTEFSAEQFNKDSYVLFHNVVALKETCRSALLTLFNFKM